MTVIVANLQKLDGKKIYKTEHKWWQNIALGTLNTKHMQNTHLVDVLQNHSQRKNKLESFCLGIVLHFRFLDTAQRCETSHFSLSLCNIVKLESPKVSYERGEITLQWHCTAK